MQVIADQAPQLLFDYSGFPANQLQQFTVGVRFEGPISSGLRWERIGTQRPADGTELVNARLSQALAAKQGPIHEFQPEEWKAFSVEHSHSASGLGPFERIDVLGPDAGGPWRSMLNRTHFILGAEGSYYRPMAGWSWDVILEASEVQPHHQRIGTPSQFSGPANGRFMNIGDAVTMKLVYARWSLSPQKGLENDWRPVQVDIFHPTWWRRWRDQRHGRRRLTGQGEKPGQARLQRGVRGQWAVPLCTFAFV